MATAEWAVQRLRLILYLRGLVKPTQPKAKREKLAAEQAADDEQQ